MTRRQLLDITYKFIIAILFINLFVPEIGFFKTFFVIFLFLSFIDFLLRVEIEMQKEKNKNGKIN